MTTRFLSATPQFTVPDLVRTAHYYRDVLGFQIAGFWDGEQVVDDPENVRVVFAIVFRDDVRVFFNVADQESVRTGRADGACDAYFNVTGIDALADDLRKRGAQIIDGPEDRSYGQRELVIADCNGLILGFGEATAPSS
jgi:predicted enzyme related to lactoylglutathione lyase